MKYITGLVLASSIAATGFVGIASSTVSAGCGVTIEVENDTGDDITVDWNDSDVRTRYGIWKRLATTSQSIDAGDEESKAFILDLGCGNDRRYRIQIEQNGNTWWEYFPTPSTYTRNTTIHVEVN